MRYVKIIQCPSCQIHVFSKQLMGSENMYLMPSHVNESASVCKNRIINVARRPAT